MSQEEIRLLYNQHRLSQDKYTYFLFAVAASAIALAVQSTKAESFSMSQIPLGIAVFFWGFSFFSGCKHVQYVNSNLFANIDYLKILQGVHPQVGNNREYIEAASAGIRQAMSTNSDVANSYSIWQFRLIIYGGLAFIAWHLVEMWLRTVGSN